MSHFEKFRQARAFQKTEAALEPVAAMIVGFGAIGLMVCALALLLPN